MARALTRADASDMSDPQEFRDGVGRGETWRSGPGGHSRSASLPAAAMTVTRPRRMKRRTWRRPRAPRTSTGSSCEMTRSPGSVRRRRPGATPSSGETITGVDAFATEMHLTPADAERLRREGFVSFTVQPIRGPRSAGITNVAAVRDPGRRPAQPGARVAPGRHPRFRPRRRPPILFRPRHSWRTRLDRVPARRARPRVGNVFWVQGRCMLVLGNQGPGPFAGPLSTGARAILIAPTAMPVQRISVNESADQVREDPPCEINSPCR